MQASAKRRPESRFTLVRAEPAPAAVSATHDGAVELLLESGWRLPIRPGVDAAALRTVLSALAPRVPVLGFELFQPEALQAAAVARDARGPPRPHEIAVRLPWSAVGHSRRHPGPGEADPVLLLSLPVRCVSIPVGV
jgi:hypothetical protein